MAELAKKVPDNTYGTILGPYANITVIYAATAFPQLFSLTQGFRLQAFLLPEDTHRVYDAYKGAVARWDDKPGIQWVLVPKLATGKKE